MTTMQDLAPFTPPPAGVTPQSFDFAGFALRAAAFEGQVWFMG